MSCHICNLFINKSKLLELILLYCLIWHVTIHKDKQKGRGETGIKKRGKECGTKQQRFPLQGGENQASLLKRNYSTLPLQRVYLHTKSPPPHWGTVSSTGNPPFRPKDQLQAQVMESLRERGEEGRTEQWWLIISVWLWERTNPTSGQGQKSFIIECRSAGGNMHILASLVQCTWPGFHPTVPCVKTSANTITHPPLRHHSPLTLSLHSALNALLTYCAHPHSSQSSLVHLLLTSWSSIVIKQFKLGLSVCDVWKYYIVYCMQQYTCIS